ncbi:hypothetical protein JCM33374_g6602 [Metschnikowia sp. JCM 33374]|nr:hypothetical protein JCM33374_g6602 [Metschnikowia sp. JCM 33374]
MSLTFSVSYQNIAKKVSCKPTSSINQLVALSLEKFRLPSSTNGCLTHNGKSLDGVTPVRLTGLVNNAKLSLSTSQGAFPVALKLVGLVDGDSVTKVLKVQSDMTLPGLVGYFFQQLAIQVALDTKLVELSVMRHKVDNSSRDFVLMTVASLVGSSTNAVVRISVQDKQAALAKQEEERERERRRQEEPARSTTNGLLAANPRVSSTSAAASAPTNESAKSVLKDTPNEDIVPQKPTQEPPRSLATENNPSISSEPPFSAPSHPTTTIPNEPTSKGSSIATNDSFYSSQTNQNHKPQIQPHEQASVEKAPAPWTLPVDKQDTVYVPSGSTTTYENPDEDYELTSNQAEKYYKILKSMQGRPPAKKAARKPSKYTIRIRFPDRTLLDLHFEDPATRLGQVLKKLDSYLVEKYTNDYSLKNGHPPFEEISFGFGANNLALQDHPHFQQEKILLIWETHGPSKGPYIKEDLQRKDVNELPTVVLESHRGNLEADDDSKKSSKLGKSDSLQSDPKAKPRVKGMPKWFRP